MIIKLKKSPSQTWGRLEYFKHKIWNSINSRTINGAHPQWNDKDAKRYLKKGIKVLLSKQEFYSWCDDNKNKIMNLYKKAKKCKNKFLGPSVDRINTNKHYSLDNIRIISKKRNTELGLGAYNKKGHTKQHHQLIGKQNSKKVKATHSITKEVLIFPSFVAAKVRGFDGGNISKATRGIYKLYKQYKWECL